MLLTYTRDVLKTCTRTESCQREQAEENSFTRAVQSLSALLPGQPVYTISTPQGHTNMELLLFKKTGFLVAENVVRGKACDVWFVYYMMA
jgi:hypothetical protein